MDSGTNYLIIRITDRKLRTSKFYHEQDKNVNIKILFHVHILENIFDIVFYFGPVLACEARMGPFLREIKALFPGNSGD